jgi:hypothetical protein
MGTGWGPKLKGRLADYANASKGTVLLGDIQAHMMKEAAKPSTRRQNIIHPSEMAKTGWCPRATYERIRACREASDPFLKPSESYGVQLLNIFDEGHYIHDKWQKRLTAMDDLWGNWRCDECYEILKNCTRYDERCPFCKSSVGYTYAEVPLRADDYLIAGHADGAVPRLNALIEIKSVGVGTARIEAPEIYKANYEGQKIDLQGLWKDIKEPFPSHIRQGQLYLALCNFMNLPFDNIIFLYESKFNQGAKEFQVKYDPAVSKPLFDHAESIVSALNGLTDPPNCPTLGCKDCTPYGNKSVTEGLGKSIRDISPEPVQSKRITSPGKTVGGSTRSSKRIV